MVTRDLAARYRGSFIGVGWSIAHPALLIALYTFVFGVILRVQVAAGASLSDFLLHLVVGLLPWLAFAEGLGRAPWILWEHAAFVKRAVFPVKVLPLTPVAVGLITQVVGFAVLAVAVPAVGGPWPVMAVALPLVLVPQLLLTAGLSWVLSSLGVFVRDLGQAIGFVLSLWFYLTPIVYPVGAVPAQARWLLALNPMTVIVEAYRRLLLQGAWPEWGSLAAVTLISAGLCLLGYVWFDRLRPMFADVL
jgi:lipopolysaccharide transport system permease protein